MFIKGWLSNSQESFSSVKEQRLWLRRGIRPLLTGKPDEVLRQGDRWAMIDRKFGNYRLADPVDNVQLSILGERLQESRTLRAVQLRRR
jgi:hypothetical protein